MTFKEYLSSLNHLADTSPETLEYIVITSADDEGNSYTPVFFPPSIGIFDEDENDFVSVDNDDFGISNAICVN